MKKDYYIVCKRGLCSVSIEQVARAYKLTVEKVKEELAKKRGMFKWVHMDKFYR